MIPATTRHSAPPRLRSLLGVYFGHSFDAALFESSSAVANVGLPAVASIRLTGTKPPLPR